jgi:hypothetical protein
MNSSRPRPFATLPEGNSVRVRVLVSDAGGPKVLSFALSAEHCRELAASLIVSASSADDYADTLRACLAGGPTDHEDATRNVLEGTH